MDIKSKGLMPNIELSQKVLEGLEVRQIDEPGSARLRSKIWAHVFQHQLNKLRVVQQILSELEFEVTPKHFLDLKKKLRPELMDSCCLS